jgi:hypothetical protein
MGGMGGMGEFTMKGPLLMYERGHDRFSPSSSLQSVWSIVKRAAR